jgi:hypothetical protein
MKTPAGDEAAGIFAISRDDDDNNHRLTRPGDHPAAARKAYISLRACPVQERVTWLRI